MQPKKKPYLSKTLIVNMIMALLAFFPSVNTKVDATQVMLIMGVINMVLRLVTKEKISLE